MDPVLLSRLHFAFTIIYLSGGKTSVVFRRRGQRLLAG